MSCSHKTKSSKTGSVKSAKTVTSVMDENNMQGLEQVINKEAEEGFGESVVDKPIPANIEEEEVYSKVLGDYEQEAVKLQEMETRLCRRQNVLDKQKELSQKRREMEAMAWVQKLQLEEQQLADQEEFMALKRQEEAVKLRK